MVAAELQSAARTCWQTQVVSTLACSLAQLLSLTRLQSHQSPLLQDELTTEKLTEAFDFLKDPSAKTAAQEIADKIATEDGVAAGVEVGSCL